MYNKPLVEAYMAGKIDLDKFSQETGQLPVGEAAQTYQVAILRKLEKLT